MPGSGDSVRIPVSLQVDASEFQSIIADMKQTVNKLAPDGKAFAGATKELAKLEREADAIALALKQGFNNPGQIEKFEQKIRALGLHLQSTAQNLSKVKFEDLNLNLVSPEELDKLKQLQAAVTEAQNRVQNFQTNKMKELVTQSAELAEGFKDLKLDINTTDYDTALKKAGDKLQDLQDKATKSAKRVADAQIAADKTKAAITAREHAKGIFNLNKTQYNEAYFKRDESGKVTQFKSGGRKLLEAQLEEWGLTPEQLKEFKKQTVESLSDFYSTIESTINNKKNIEKLDKKNADAQKELIDAQNEQSKIDQVTTSIQQLIATLQQLYNIQDASNVYHAEYEQETKQVQENTKAVEEQKEAIVELTQVRQESNQEGQESARVTKQNANALHEDAVAAKENAAAIKEAEDAQKHLTDAIKRWFSFREVINLTKRAVVDAVNHIKELDATMTQIAVVTNMTQSDLWDQIGIYSAIAQQYGVTTNGVYEVSQLYYQQGLQTAEVMNLTEETLKMAKIANLDYATSTDYMTVALRGFKMEMSEAQRVTDVYSRLAAISASDTEELAVAMSKTASSAEAVGSSFENTSAMIALMVETTREAPENIGSAMKSIISRYGELKTSPEKLVDSEGEELSFNKVDAALQSVGVSMHDANGQFRAFDEVIMDLSKKWQTLDRNTQRYIATVMAGNRQQSRFLALVSSYDRLAELTEEAANSQDAGTLQYLKTLDSLETKINQLRVAFQEFYTSMGLENLFKGALDTLTGFITKLNSLPKLFNTIPVAAIGMGANLVLAVKNILTLLAVPIYQSIQRLKNNIKNITGGNNKVEIKFDEKKTIDNAYNLGKKSKKAFEAGMEGTKIPIDQASRQVADDAKTGLGSWLKTNWRGITNIVGSTVKAVGATMAAVSLTKEDKYEDLQKGQEASKVQSGLWGAGGNIVGGIVSGAAMGPWGALAGGVLGLIQSIPNLITLVDGLNVTSEERIQQLNKEIEAAKNEVILKKNEVTTLESEAKKLKELQDSRYESAEANQEYIDYMNQLTESHHDLMGTIDSEGNSIVSLDTMYQKLITTRGLLVQAEENAREKELKYAIEVSKQTQEQLSSQRYMTSGAGDAKGTEGTLANISSGIWSDNKVTYQLSNDKSTIFTTEDFYKYFTNVDYKAEYDDKTMYDLVDAYLKNKDEVAKEYIQAKWPQLLKYLEENDNITSIEQLVSSGPYTKEVLETNLAPQVSLEKLITTLMNNELEINEQNEELLASMLASFGFNEDIFNSTSWINVIKQNGETIQTQIKQLYNDGAGVHDILNYLLNLFADYFAEGQKLSNYQQELAEINAKRVSLDRSRQHWVEDNGEKFSNRQAAYEFLNDDLISDMARMRAETFDSSQDWAEFVPLFEKYQNIWPELLQLLYSTDDFGNVDQIKNKLLELGIKEQDLLNIYPVFADAWEQEKEKIIEWITDSSADFLKDYEQILNLDNNHLLKQENIQLDNLPLDYWQTAVTNFQSIGIQYIKQGLYTQGRQLNDAYNSLLQSNLLQDSTIASIIVETDIFDKESIENAQKKLAEYAETSGTDVSEIDQYLTDIVDALIKNYNTIVNTWIDSSKTAIKQTETFAKNISSGMDYDTALEEYQKLIANGYSGAFNSIIEFDKTLGKFVYTTDGIREKREEIIEKLDAEYESTVVQLKNQLDLLNNISSNAVYEDALTAYKATDDSTLKDSYILALIDTNLDVETQNKQQILLQQIFAVAEQRQLSFADALDIVIKDISDNSDRIKDLYSFYQDAINSNINKSTFETIQWNKIKIGAFSNDEINKQIENYLSSIGSSINETIKQYIEDENWTDLIKELQKQGKFELSYSELATLLETPFDNAASKISDLFNIQIGTAVSEEVNDLLVAAKVEGFSIDSLGIIHSFEQLVASADAVYRAMPKTNENLAERNYAFAAILEGKQLQQDSAKGIIESSADLSYDNLADYANLLGESLDDIITKGIWIIQDEFGKYRITDEGIAQLTEKVNISEWELAEAIKSRNEVLIEADKKITGGIVDEINALIAAKPGDKVDLTYLSTKFKDIIQDLGLNIENGFATITENTNIFDIVNKIQAAIIEDGSFLQSDIDALGDALDQLLKTYTSLIGSGISGTLSRSDATQLQNFATANLGGLKLDFNKTANGLKLSRNSAIQLYAELKKVDSLAAEIMLDNFADDLAKTDTSLNNISATMARIHDLQTQDTAAAKAELVVYQDLLQVQRARADSYSFMDNKLPEGMQGPENYWNAVGTAYKAMNESAKSGYMEVQDLYNIVNEMNNLANITGNTLEFMGKDLSGKAEDAANLITWAMQALSNIDGEGVKLDLSKLGIDLAAGADSMSSGFDKAINDMAESQIKMLDAEIALLEAVVAMEDLGNIDVDSNGLELDEVFRVEKLSDGSQKVLGFSEDWVKLLDQVKAKMDESPDLTKTLESIKIQGKSLAEIIKTPYEDLEKLGFSNEQYLSVMDSVVKMATSGDYSIENVMKSVSEIAAANGISTEIQLETGTVAVGYGQYLVRDEKKDVYVVDGKEYKDPELALQAAALGAQKGLEAANFNAETNQMESEWRIEGIGTFSVFFEDNQIKYRDGNETFNSQQELINYLWEHNSSASGFNSKQDWAKHYNIPLELVPDFEVDSTALAGASAEAKQALAQELASGQVTKETLVSVGIEYNKDLSNLTDADLQQIADLAGIDRKTVALDLAAEVTGDLATGVTQMIKDGKLSVTIALEPTTQSIDLTNLIATATGTLSLSDCTFTLNEDGSVTIIKPDGTAVTTIPVQELSGEGSGNISNYDVILTDGVIHIIDAEGNEISTISVPNKPVSDGSGTISNYKLVLNDGVIQVVNSTGQVVKVISVPELTGFGHGDLIGATLKFDEENGKVNVVKSDGTTLGAINVEELEAIGSGSLKGGDCTVTYDGGKAILNTTDANGNPVTIEVDLPDGEGTGSLPQGNCTYTYDPTTGTVDVTGLNGTTFTFNLNEKGAIVQGSGSLDESNLTYNYVQTGDGTIVSVTGLEGQQFIFTIPSGTPVKGTGTFHQNNVFLEYVPQPDGTVNVSMKTSEGLSISIPADVAVNATGSFTDGDITYNYEKDEEGNVHVDGFDKEGTKIIEFDMPSDVTAHANILSAMLQWTGGKEGWNYEDLLDENNTIVIDGVTVQVGVQHAKVVDSGATKELRNKLYSRYNASYKYGSLIDTGLKDEITPEGNGRKLLNADSDTAKFLEDIRVQAQELHQPLDTIQTDILNLIAKTAGANFIDIDLDEEGIVHLDEYIKGLQEVNEINLSDQSGQLSILAQAFSGLDAEQLLEVVAALAQMAISSDGIFGHDWSELVDNLNSINGYDFSNFQTWSSKLSTILTQVLGIWSYIRNFANQTFTVDLKETKTITVNRGSTTDMSDAKGNVALAAGRTLMGELGPELWVSNGHYYVAGQNGAEFVDLPKDAIVFNHLQTKKLMSSGSAGRGVAVTNERNAVARATGTGPAMASAKEALAQLKQIRAMWQAMLGATAQELGSMAGRGGGGGSGGGNDNKFSPEIGDYERWYNWLRKIEKLEQQITLEEAKRANMMNGHAYGESIERDIERLHEERAILKDLAEQQQAFYDKRRKVQEDSMFGQMFTYDEHGLMQYKPDVVDSLLAKLTETDEHGNYTGAAESSVKQVEYLQKWLKEHPGKNGVADLSEIIIDPETGKKLSTTNEEEAAKIMERFWDEFDGWIDELDGLYDSYNDKLKDIQDLIKKENELLKEYVDNQLSLEEEVMKAIEAREQATIDAMTKEKDALSKAASDYISGLTQALDKERQLYAAQQDTQETSRLQRQLAILQRSGGSAAEIKSLQDQLSERLQDSYFDAQQAQIDAVKEASDAELQRLEQQIEIAQETLDYYKEHGLFNEEMQSIMQRSDDDIIGFIQQYNPKEWDALSTLASEEKLAELTKMVQLWTEDRGKEVGWKEMRDQMLQADKTLTAEDLDKYHGVYAKAYKEEFDKSGDMAAARQAAQEAVKTARIADQQAPVEEVKTETTTTTEPEKPQFESFTGTISSGGRYLYEQPSTTSKIVGHIGPEAGTGKSFTVLDYDPSHPGWGYVKVGKQEGWAQLTGGSIDLETQRKIGVGGGSSTSTGGQGGGQTKKAGGDSKKDTIYDETTGEGTWTKLAGPAPSDGRESKAHKGKVQDPLTGDWVTPEELNRRLAMRQGFVPNTSYMPTYNSDNLLGTLDKANVDNTSNINNNTNNSKSVIFQNAWFEFTGDNAEEVIMDLNRRISNTVSR